MPKRELAGGRTPEELETLLEDAIVLGDIDGLLRLFAPRGLLACPVTAPAHGATDIARSARALISADWAYVAEPTLVLQADRTALVVAPHALNVVRRGRDGLWRYEICHVNPSTPPAVGRPTGRPAGSAS